MDTHASPKHNRILTYRDVQCTPKGVQAMPPPRVQPYLTRPPIVAALWCDHTRHVVYCRGESGQEFQLDRGVAAEMLTAAARGSNRVLVRYVGERYCV